MTSLSEGVIFYSRRILLPLVFLGAFSWLLYTFHQDDIRKYQPQCVQRPVILKPSSPSTAQTRTRPTVKEALARSETSYKTFVERRDALLTQMGFGSSKFSPWEFPTVWWWYFQPAFTCPHDVQRIGTVADGGKWVCGFSLYEARQPKKCVVYSLGISGDSSFEDEILSRTDCEVYGFDASVDSMASGLAGNPRAHFHKVFIGKEDKVDSSGNQWKTLKTIMKELGHTWIDILKIDIEGSEYDTLEAMMDDFARDEALPFSQLQLEIHLVRPGRSGEIPFGEFLLFWRRLEAAGLRPFWTEPNLLPTIVYKTPLWYSEYSFINVAGRHALIED